MDNAFYVGLSRQMVLRREMDIVANNIANADTPGFKVEALMSRGEHKAPPHMPASSGMSYAKAAGVARNFGQGSLHSTDAPLDIAIEGQGFFKITTGDGDRFTRDGHFRTDGTGRLTTQAGDPVADEGGGEITLDPEKGQVSIADDGVVSQGGQQVGKVGVFAFEDLAALDKVGNNFFENTSNLAPKPAEQIKVRQGMLEASNVKPIEEITRMIEVSRAYEQMSRMIDTQGDLSSKAIQSLGRVQ